jgi:malonyl-CoA decarboxylase
VLERLQQARREARERGELSRLAADCRKLLTERGESNSVAIASQAIERYRRLSPEATRQFFDLLATEFDPDPGEVLRLAEEYAVSRSPENLVRLSRAAEPPRQELLRRLNRAPGGTGTIVAMRAQLLHRLRQERRLLAVDADFEHLLGSWFNPGFLKLVQVDWSSPALLLEKIIQHEAVHEIDGWADLRRRLQPDRRCFAFFHPVLPDEPLIFVEVALVPEMPAAIAPLLDRNQPAQADASRFKVAVFYSISNCQPGLRGVNLGNFLIKRVAERLHEEFPRLRSFCTLSPIPSFADWVAKVERLESERLKPAALQSLEAGLARLRERYGADLSRLSVGAAAAAGAAQGQALGAVKSDEFEADEAALRALCAFHLSHTTPGEASRSDPVARFHLNNGARLERINAMADLSRKGLRQSHGLMVNYLYDLDEIEANHERFVAGEVTASRAVRSLMS